MESGVCVLGGCRERQCMSKEEDDAPQGFGVAAGGRNATPSIETFRKRVKIKKRSCGWFQKARRIAPALL